MIPSVPYYKLSDRIIETFLHLLAVIMIFFSMIDSIYSIDGFISRIEMLLVSFYFNSSNNITCSRCAATGFIMISTAQS